MCAYIGMYGYVGLTLFVVGRTSSNLVLPSQHGAITEAHLQERQRRMVRWLRSHPRSSHPGGRRGQHSTVGQLSFLIGQKGKPILHVHRHDRPSARLHHPGADRRGARAQT